MNKFGYAPFAYSTGRTYDVPQVLWITVENKAQDTFGIWDVTATFKDASRGISGRVKTVVFGNNPIGEAVLAEYDAGRYVTL